MANELSNRLRYQPLAPERDADPVADSPSVSGISLSDRAPIINPMLPMALLSSFKQTAYVSGAENTVRMISALLSTLE